MPDSAQPRRPRVICHMFATVDGRIVTTGWPDLGAARREYERTAATFEADGWMCGRITMEPFAGAVRDPDAPERAPGAGARPDHMAPGAHAPYAVAMDPSGRLAWQGNEIDGDHVVAVLTARVSDDYLASLRDRGVSYLFAGDREVDLDRALHTLADRFGIRTLLLEGGGRINGAMLRDGLVDELSVLVAPVADGTIGTPSLFDADDPWAGREAQRLALQSVERREGDVLWLRYRVEREG